MGLKLYFKSNDEFKEVSNGDDFETPVTTTHNGKTGDTKTTALYLRNDDSSKWFSNIVVRPVDLVDANPYGDVSYVETGWGVKLNQGGTEPTLAEWGDIDWGDQINMSNIGSNSVSDTTTYFPFWYLITCPPNEDAQTKSDIVLRLEYTENAVTV